jgi:hypothetical protein
MQDDIGSFRRDLLAAEKEPMREHAGRNNS